MSFAARILRKLSIRGVPVPGLLRISRRPIAPVYLTFDDGPAPQTTPQVLKLLREYKAQATFFVCGQCVEKNSELTAEIIRNGHILANHTYSHPDLTRLTTSEALHEIERTQKLLAPFHSPRLFRPTRGLIGPRLWWALWRRGYRIIFWSQDCGDWEGKPESELATRLARRVQPGDVVLFHDDQPNSVAILDLFLADTKSRGFQFDILQ